MCVKKTVQARSGGSDGGVMVEVAFSSLGIGLIVKVDGRLNSVGLSAISK